MKNNRKKLQGQSMMEMVFSIGLLITAISAVIALNISNINSQKQSEYLVIANNLAREGVEVIRNFRDTNWLSGQNWDQGMDAAGNFLPVFNEDTNQWSLEPFAPPATARLFLSASGVYSYDDQAGLPTLYYRYLTLKPVCLDMSETIDRGRERVSDVVCDTVKEKKVGLSVRAQVSWVEKNRNREVIIEDLLYDWK